MDSYSEPTINHADQFTDHWWWRPGWRPGRRMYTFFITFDESLTTAEDLVRAYRPVTDRAGLDPIPAPWLHLTLQGLGFTDEVSMDDVHAVLGLVMQRCSSLASLRLELGPVIVASEGVVLLTDKVDELRKLQASVREACTTVIKNAELLGRNDSFTPHVTLAYSNGSGPTKSVLASAVSIQSPRTTVHFRNIKLVALGRDSQLYTWETVSRIPFGS